MFDLDPNSKIWIYQAARSFTKDEAAEVQTSLNAFVASWAAHGQPLSAAGKLLHNIFVVLAVDETKHGASGCSIDSSVALIQEFERRFMVNMFDRGTIVCALGTTYRHVPMHRISKEIEAGDIHADTLIFDNLIPRLEDLRHNWLKPISKTWASRFLVNASV